MEEKFYYIWSKDEPREILLSVGLFRKEDGTFIRTCAMKSPRDQNNKKLAKEILIQRALKGLPDGRKHYRNTFRSECIQRLVDNSTVDEIRKLMFPKNENVPDIEF